MKSRTVIIIGLLFAASFVLGVIYYLPPIDDFHLANPFWNGLSRLKRLESPSVVEDLRYLPSQGAGEVLLIIGPSKTFTSSEVAAVSSFLTNGGILILADDFGSGNDLLNGLGLKTLFSGELLADPLFNVKNSRLPRATQVDMGSIASLALNYATILDVADKGVRVVAWSSSFSYLDMDQNGKGEPLEPVGPFPILVEIRYGGGRVYLISDSSIFINGVIEHDDNRLLLNTIARSKALFVDTSHWSEGMLTLVKKDMLKGYEFLSRLDVRYTLLLISIAVIFRVKKGKVKASKKLDEVETVLEEHPDWDRETLRRLREDMKKYGSS